MNCMEWLAPINIHNEYVKEMAHGFFLSMIFLPKVDSISPVSCVLLSSLILFSIRFPSQGVKGKALANFFVGCGITIFPTSRL